MKCQILFSVKNKIKNSICHLLKISQIEKRSLNFCITYCHYCDGKNIYQSKHKAMYLMM